MVYFIYFTKFCNIYVFVVGEMGIKFVFAVGSKFYDFRCDGHGVGEGYAMKKCVYGKEAGLIIFNGCSWVMKEFRDFRDSEGGCRIRKKKKRKMVS